MHSASSLIQLGFYTCLLAMGAAHAASDVEKEKRWEAQIVDNLLVGEAVKLKVATGEFLGIYTASSSKTIHGAAIVIHGIGAHPAWPEVIDTIRSHLPEHGWHTLSIQMPILGNDAKSEDYVPLLNEVAPRMNAAVALLKQKGVKNIVLVAHSLGATMSSAYLADKPDPAIRAFVGIGMGKAAGDPRMDNAVALSKIKIPVLDIYGSLDLQAVTENAKARAAASNKAGNEHYTQFQVSGADHFFNQMDQELIKRVRGWLEKNAPGK